MRQGYEQLFFRSLSLAVFVTRDIKSKCVIVKQKMSGQNGKRRRKRKKWERNDLMRRNNEMS